MFVGKASPGSRSLKDTSVSERAAVVDEAAELTELSGDWSRQKLNECVMMNNNKLSLRNSFYFPVFCRSCPTRVTAGVLNLPQVVSVSTAVTVNVQQRATQHLMRL